MLQSHINTVFENDPVRIIISKPVSKSGEYRKVIITRKTQGFQIEKLTQKQAFHENIAFKDIAELKERCLKFLSGEFAQLNAWSESSEYSIMVSKKGKATLTKSRSQSFKPEKIQMGHNRQKEYIFNEGDIIPPMIDMGIMSKDGKIIHSMYDKFKQINRFAQIIDDVIEKNGDRQLNIIDFGCGKSYLTFILYYYFTEVKKIDVTMTGLDLKADVIEKCNAAAKKYGYSGLHFELGDINGYKSSIPVDMVVTLHACDTATDYALYNAVMWNAKMIFSVPCCQHELNKQIESSEFSILTKYGIVKERTAALMTDAIRGSLLEACGYKTQLMEFVDFAHTPKNILIRAQKGSAPDKKAIEEVKRLMKEFNLEPTLYNLLENAGKL